MESSSASQSAPRRPPMRNRGAKAATFRVCTADDFHLREQRNREKRRSGQTSTACRMCHLRKIKCSENDHGNGVYDTRSHRRNPKQRSSCQPCEEANLECQWDLVDRRRRQRGVAGEAVESVDGEHNHAPIARSPKEHSPSPDTRGRQIFDFDFREDANGQHVSLATPSVGMMAEALGLGTFSLQSPSNENGDPASFTTQAIRPGICEVETAQFPQTYSELEDLVFDFGIPDEWPKDCSTFSFGPSLSLNTPRELLGKRTHSLMRIRCYRRFGPTAISPGLGRLALIVKSGEEEQFDIDKDTTCNENTRNPPRYTASSTSLSRAGIQLFDDSGRQPHQRIIPRIFDIFFEHLGGHFPFVRSEVASSFLLNAIAALALRFCPTDSPLVILEEKQNLPWRNGLPFLAKAKEQLVPLLSVPEPEIVAGLVLLSWAEFGEDNEAGLWMFAGMAIRMAQDLGFHRTTETDTDPNLIFHDHARPSPDGTYALTNEQSALHQQKARLVMFCPREGHSAHHETIGAATGLDSCREAVLVRIRESMILRYNMLPKELIFNVENLKASSSSLGR
ncbi:pathway-specific nitrogen regulator [Colletotrichum chrysophilum]|uniref:Pathway-specific nitrogen regulator n=1 Tax=Colletotrichum chrysophilum TaxID=1836956 RepID=A0AAD9A8T2_9PEZI|nr:pathway-specific nitrogen regulator [Colletotrichum chrysophilum]